MKTTRNILAIILVFVGLIIISGCDAEKSLKQRTAKYHNYIYGHASNRDRLSNYWSPELVNQYKSAKREVKFEAGKKDYSNYDFEQDRINQRIKTSAFAQIASADVEVIIGEKWAVSNVKPVKGIPEGLLYRWVKVRNGWYVYKGSEKEVKAYGKFEYPSR